MHPPGDMVIDDGPHRVDVVRVQGGYEIQAGRHRAFFRDNPNLVADELERWQAFYFREFLPQLPRFINRPPATLAASCVEAIASHVRAAAEGF